MRGFLSLDSFKNLLAASDVKDPTDALRRPFFYGVIRYDAKGTKVVEEQPVYSEKGIQERLQDERFCRFCFEFDKHDFKCRNGGWV
jgi:hypothetical protein